MKTLYKWAVRASDEWELNDSTRNFIVAMFAVTLALTILLIVGGFIFAIMTGRILIPESVTDTFWRALITILVATGPFVAAQLQKRVSDKNAIATQTTVKEAHLETENKIKDGIGSILAGKIAEKVQEPPRNPNARERKSDRIKRYEPPNSSSGAAASGRTSNEHGTVTGDTDKHE